MSPKPSKSLALRIVQRMGETGQPPERGALFVNVGTEEQLEVLRTRYLAEIRETGRNAQGVKLLTLKEGERLQDIARVMKEDEAEEIAAETELSSRVRHLG